MFANFQSKSCGYRHSSRCPSVRICLCVMACFICLILAATLVALYILDAFTHYRCVIGMISKQLRTPKKGSTELQAEMHVECVAGLVKKLVVLRSREMSKMF